MKPTCLTLLSLLLLLLFPILTAALGGGRGPVLGGWTPIKDLNDPHVKEIAEFAVSEYNKSSKASLKLEKVVSGETQVVSGMNYRLVLSASGGSKGSGKYQAVVWEKPWENFRSLTSFNPV